MQFIAKRQGEQMVTVEISGSPLHQKHDAFVSLDVHGLVLFLVVGDPLMFDPKSAS